MWPKIWRRCALWPSCAKQRCWRTCGQGPCWDRRCWYLQGYQETLQTGCPCEPVPCDRRDLARRGNRKPHWQSGGEVSCRESQCRTAQRNPAQVMLRCCRQSRRGSGSGGERREQHCLESLLRFRHCSTETQSRISVRLLHPDGFKMSLPSLPLPRRFCFYLCA